MQPENDPRVFFAAERTLLAWLRTGLAVIGVGFLVARFGLFLAIASQQTHQHHPRWFSTMLGIGFVLLGSVMIGVAAWQQVQFCRDLPADQRPIRYWMTFSVWMAGLIAVLGCALAVYLLLSANKLDLGSDVSFRELEPRKEFVLQFLHHGGRLSEWL